MVLNTNTFLGYIILGYSIVAAIMGITFWIHNNIESDYKIESKGLLFKEIESYKEYLMFAGKYNCCLDEPCNYCLFEEGYCDCRFKLFNGEEICGECLGEWIKGNGHKCPMMFAQFSLVYPEIWELIKDKYNNVEGFCHA